MRGSLITLHLLRNSPSLKTLYRLSPSSMPTPISTPHSLHRMSFCMCATDNPPRIDSPGGHASTSDEKKLHRRLRSALAAPKPPARSACPSPPRLDRASSRPLDRLD